MNEPFPQIKAPMSAKAIESPSPIIGAVPQSAIEATPPIDRPEVTKADRVQKHKLSYKHHAVKQDPGN